MRLHDRLAVSLMLRFLLLAVVAPAGAVVIAPFLPFPALVVADIVAEARSVV